ncbi:MAG: hypothetical protein D6830_04580 [Ignavibacteria bacterium]|nr:MAG: hypothetical protein D6830_04580 [Ignavibacteria bacterium]
MRKKIIILFLISAAILAQKMKLPDNPLEGRIVFEEKGCIECHSISGYGGNIGPDLGKQPYYGSISNLAALIWNHIPKMNRMFRKLHKDRPNFTPTEMSNLISFIYYIPYLGQPGSLSRGKLLLQNKGCLDCHSVKGYGEGIAPDFSEIEFNSSPLFLAQAMWNHLPSMLELFEKKGKNLGGLEGKDLTDIFTYLTAISKNVMNTGMSPGNPNKGKKVFISKGCINCHDIEGEEGDKPGPGLKILTIKNGVNDIAAVMLNHSSAMMEMMEENNIEWPEFHKTELADLIAFIYFLNFSDKPGDPVKGESAFINVGCSNCHSSDDGVGPNLVEGYKLKSPISLITKMWNHSGQMENETLSLNEEWPQLTAEDFNNIYSFIRNGNKRRKVK